MAEGFPRKFGKYHLLMPLAQGGMGALYLAVTGDRGLEKLCVIKTVLPHLADAEYVSRFRDEAKVVVRLSHGNLVPVFDAGQVGGELFLAMDFVEGKDLRAVWNRCAKKTVAFPVDVAVHIVKELCRGLGYAHSFGELKLVHRDVSPPNVLVSFAGEVKLTDFGLASSTLKLEKTAPGVIYGKVSYMSPEQARGEPLDGRTDLYAAGIILWELLTGRQLFPPGESQPFDLMSRSKNPRPDPPSRRAPRVPPALDAIVLKALEPDPRERFQVGEEMRAALAEWLAREAPATDAARLEKFVSGLFAEDIARERNERESLILKTRQRLTVNPGIDERQLGAKVKTPPPSARDERASTVRHTPRPQPSNVSPPRAPTTPPAGAATSPRDVPQAAAPEPTPRLDATKKGIAVSVPQPGPGGQTVVPSRPLSDGAMQALAERLDDDPFHDDSGEGDPQEIVGHVVQGRYLVKSLLGEGGMGRVYEAEHVEIGKRVALKILHPVYSRTPDVVARFRREARAASRIGHPNIVDVTDSGTTEGGAVYFVMEYLEGVELAAVIDREGAIDIQRALNVGTQICRALAAAHQAGIIHRDLKPENVFLIVREGTTDFVKVLDFGIAKSAELEEQRRERLTHPGMAMGTPEYMAPEQAAGKPADARSDVYAVGAILYEMLTGRPPYEGENFMEILTKKATIEPQPVHELRPDVPDMVERVVAKAMARDPGERPRSMEALEYELTKCLAGRGAAVAKMLGVPADAALAAAGATLGGDTAVAGLLSARGSGAVPAVGALAGLPAANAPAVEATPPAGGPLVPSAPATVAPIGLLPPPRTEQIDLVLTAEEKKKYRIGTRWGRWFFLFLLLGGGGAAGYWYKYVHKPGEPILPPGLFGDEALDAGVEKAIVPPPVEAKPEREHDKKPERKSEPREEKPDPRPEPRDDKPEPARAEKPEPKPEARPAPPPVEDLGKPPRDKREAKLILDKAKKAEALRKYAEARDLYKRLAAGKLMRGEGLLGVARVAWQTKEADTAASFAQQAIDEGAGDAARLLLGHAYFKQQKYDQAIEQYKAVLANDPKNAEALRTLRAAEKAKAAN